MSIETRVALVTGAGRGIGRSIALRLAKEGYALELCNLDAAELDHCVAELAAADAKVIGAESFDLRDRNATDEWLRRLRGRHERIDALVHNAGVGGPDPEDQDEALKHLEEVLAVNATAPLRITRGLAKLLPEGSARVVIIASVLGKMGVPGFSAYCSSKAAAIGLVRALASDLARRRITVNGVCPGWTDTAMAQQGFEAIAGDLDTDPAGARAIVEEGLPLGRIVNPDEVAGLVAFLLGPDAGSMSGQCMTMSAGDLQR